MRRATGLATALVLAGSALLGADAAAERVAKVIDGDSIRIHSGTRTVDVRLADIDAPEHGQPFGDAARAALAAIVGGREVRLEVRGGDAYRRIVAVVHAGRTSANVEMVRQGLAWVRRRYVDDPVLIGLEDAARAARRGLWRDADPIAPWDWRRGSKSSRRRAREAAAPAPDRGACGTRNRCAQMRSCAQARFHLRTCGVRTLDGDGDGVPCEALCR